MSETVDFNELNELHKDLEALEEDLKDLYTELTHLVFDKEEVVLVFEECLEVTEPEPTELIHYKTFLERVIEEGLKDPKEIKKEFAKSDCHEQFLDFVTEDVKSMRILKNLERKIQTKKKQILDKKEEIWDKKEEIKEEESMTEEQIRERGIKPYRQ